MRILIADDHTLVRDTLKAFLQAAGIEAVATAKNLPDAMAIAMREGPFDLALLDYDMPGMNGLEGLQRMLSASHVTRVALLSGAAGIDVARSAISAGAVGFVPKTIDASDLGAAVERMAAGKLYVPADLPDARPRGGAGSGFGLSGREREVLSCVCRGLANKEIARELDLSEVTIKLHVRTLCRKLQAKNRTHAAMIARDAGLH